MSEARIRVIDAPAVAIVGRMAADAAAMAGWLRECGVESWASDAPSGGEKLAEFGGRLCYHSFARPRPGGNEAFIRHILEVGHGSVCEHAVYAVAIAGVSRSLSHEIVRHRHLSPSQLSQRYYDESDAAFVVPPAILPGKDAFEADPFVAAGFGWAYGEWFRSIDHAIGGYREIVAMLEIAAFEHENGPAEVPGFRHEVAVEWLASLSRSRRTSITKRVREAARSVLPNSTETRLILTGNARAWRGVCEQRGSIHADLEIRRLACVLARLFRAESPNLFFDVEVFQDEDGRESVRTTHRKV